MKKLLLFTLLCYIMNAGILNSQTPTNYCGTPNEMSEWLIDYLSNPEAHAHARSADDTLYVAMQVNSLAANSGSSFYSENLLMETMYKLNADYKPSKVVFYMKRPIKYIVNSRFYDHVYSDGIEMMATHNVADAVNCYIVGNPDGNCGYYAPAGNAVALGIGCLGGNSSTWTHELGHFFTLPHTFLGWEGRDYNPNEPTPTRVGSRNVERVNGTNCTISGDGFCDTPPDYLSDRWTCDNQGFSSVTQKDPLNENFKSDGTLFMSYSNDACTSRFSDEQIDAMRANMLSQRIAYTSTTRPFEYASSQVTISTEDNQDVESGKDFLIEWNTVDHATGYLVQVSRFASFTFQDHKEITTEPFFNVKEMEDSPNRNYFVRVMPILSHTFDSKYSNVVKFTKVTPTSVVKNDFGSDIKLYPNPLTSNSNLTIDNLPQAVNYEIITTSGVVIKKGRLNQGKNTLDIKENLVSGLLIVRLFDEQNEAIFKIASR